MEATGSFVDLMRSVKAGDEDAITQMMHLTREPLCRIARGLIGKALQSQLDEVDLVQSVQLTLWQGFRDGHFEVASPQALLALGRTLLRRNLARYWRAAKPMSDLIETSLTDTLVDGPIYPVATPTERDPADAAEYDDIVGTFLAQLNDLDRELIKLRLEGFSTADAARKLNVDAGFLRVRLGRLRARFTKFHDWIAKLSERDA